MRRLCRFFIILILACTVVGCSPDEEDMLNLFWVVPIRQAYNVDDTFKPKEDMDMFFSTGGEMQTVVKSQVTIILAEPPYSPEDMKEVPVDDGYKLKKKGSNVIVLEYEGLSTSYSIEVSEPTGEPKDSGIIIKWEGDK